MHEQPCINRQNVLSYAKVEGSAIWRPSLILWARSEDEFNQRMRHIRLASNIAKYVAQWLMSNIYTYIVGSCEHFNFLIHQLIPNFIWAPSKDSFSKTIQACFENSLKTIQSDKDGAQMKSGISWCIKKLKSSHEPTI